MEPFSKGFVEIMAAEQSVEEKDWFQGTADAVRRCLKHFNDPNIKYVIVLSGDQLYKMNLRDILKYHLENNAEVTLACNRVDVASAPDLGIIGVDRGNKIKSFIEKPKDASVIEKMTVKHDGETFCLGSMGIYLFNKSTLIDLLMKDNKVDFGREIIPDAIKRGETYAYVFDGYWRDIGTIKAFYEENLMLTEPLPPLDMFDETWQIYTRPRYLPPAKFKNSLVEKSIIAEGAIILSAKISHSIIGLRLRVGEETVIKDTIAMGSDYYQTAEQIDMDHANGVPLLGVGQDCQIERAILDKNVRIGNGVKIVNVEGVSNFDGPNYCIRDGIVIISKSAVIPDGTVI